MINLSDQKTYEERGDYHENLDPGWSYYPTYLAKKKFVLGILANYPKDSKILDMGCGEGVFIKGLMSLGFSNVVGVDLNYESDFVKRGDILDTGFLDKSFDAILLLDVIEHLSFDDQEKALAEIHRILKDDGAAILSIPNLAHIYSRVSFLLKGSLKRTANIKKHPGDRPISEYIELIKGAGFQITKRKGLFPTYPVFYNAVILFPRKTLWAYNLANKLAAYTNFCFINIFVLKKSDGINKRIS